jgi:hypothetical protein
MGLTVTAAAAFRSGFWGRCSGLSRSICGVRTAATVDKAYQAPPDCAGIAEQMPSPVRLIAIMVVRMAVGAVRERKGERALRAETVVMAEI